MAELPVAPVLLKPILKVITLLKFVLKADKSTITSFYVSCVRSGLIATLALLTSTYTRSEVGFVRPL